MLKNNVTLSAAALRACAVLALASHGALSIFFIGVVAASSSHLKRRQCILFVDRGFWVLAVIVLLLWLLVAFMTVGFFQQRWRGRHLALGYVVTAVAVLLMAIAATDTPCWR